MFNVLLVHLCYVFVKLKVKKLKETVERLENENRQLHASMEVCMYVYTLASYEMYTHC